MAVFAEGLRDPEGPTLLPDGSWIVVEMHPSRGCVSEVSANGMRREIARTGRPNGSAVDADEVIWIAESGDPSIVALQRDGSIVGRWYGPDDAPFLWPNDLCFGPDGLLYMTDSGIAFDQFAPDGEVRPDQISRNRELVRGSRGGRLFRFDPGSKRLEVLRQGLRFPNGIAFGDDGLLYVAETATGDILAYELDGDLLVDRGVHTNVLPEDLPGAFIGPDGIALDRDGNLYVCVLGFGDLVIVAPSGEIVDRMDAGGAVCTNVAFGPPGSRTIYITEDETGRMLTLPARADGATLYDGSVRP